jgi:hypothetical protein
MAKAINLLLAAALAAAAFAAALRLAETAKPSGAIKAEICVERLCGVVFF